MGCLEELRECAVMQFASSVATSHSPDIIPLFRSRTWRGKQRVETTNEWHKVIPGVESSRRVGSDRCFESLVDNKSSKKYVPDMAHKYSMVFGQDRWAPKNTQSSTTKTLVLIQAQTQPSEIAAVLLTYIIIFFLFQIAEISIVLGTFNVHEKST